MATLTEPQKLFIVQALACYDTPTQVSNAVREEFGIEVDRRRVHEYDPTRLGGRGLGKKLKAVFDETRKAFLADVSTIPIASQAYRLRTLNRLLVKVEGQGNTALAAQLVEQAAKETGGTFTNRREVTGADGAPVMTPMSLADFYAGTRSEPQPGSS